MHGREGGFSYWFSLRGESKEGFPTGVPLRGERRVSLGFPYWVSIKGGKEGFPRVSLLGFPIENPMKTLGKPKGNPCVGFP